MLPLHYRPISWREVKESSRLLTSVGCLCRPARIASASSVITLISSATEPNFWSIPRCLNITGQMAERYIILIEVKTNWVRAVKPRLFVFNRVILTGHIFPALRAFCAPTSLNKSPQSISKQSGRRSAWVHSKLLSLLFYIRILHLVSPWREVRESNPLRLIIGGQDFKSCLYPL